MAKINASAGLSVALAGQQAGAEGAGSAVVASRTLGAAGVWRVPTLPDGFNLHAAMTEATRQALTHYQDVLIPEGLRVAPATQGVGADVAQPAVQVLEYETGRVMRMYTAGDFLTMFAQQRQSSGVVVDGQV